MEALSFIELFALVGLAVAQPVFEKLGGNPELFLLWRTTRLELVLLTAILLFAVPFLFWAVEFLVGCAVPRARRFVHATLLGLAAGSIAVQALKATTGFGPAVLIVGGVAGGVIIAGARLRWQATATWLRVLAIAPLVFGSLFLGTTGASEIVFNADAPTLDVKVRNPARVVWVSMDEFAVASMLDGSGRIDRELFPNIAALADGATWYRNTTTVSGQTTTAVPAALTGLLPGNTADVPSTAEHPRNLFTLLGGTYDLHVREAATRLCPPRLCPPPPPRAGVHPGLRGMLVATSKIWRRNAAVSRTPEQIEPLDQLDDRALRTMDRFTAGVRPTDRPTVDFMHVFLPHFPWHYLPTGQDYNGFQSHGYGLVPSDRSGIASLMWSTRWTALAGKQRNLMNAQAADGAIGRLIARLRAIGAYEDTVIVITADHGVSFEARRTFRGVTPGTWSDIAWIPLIIKAPGQQAGSVDDRAAESIDILPTVADHLGLDIPYRVDGRSLLEPPRSDLPVRILKWGANTVDPPPDTKFVSFDRETGLREVLAKRAVPPGGPAWRRPFLIGPYGDLIGRDVDPLVDTASPRRTGGIDYSDRYLIYADPLTAASVPWADSQGTFNGPPGVDLAFAANGRIVCTTRTQRADDGRTLWWCLVPPPLMRLGPNEMSLYEIRGTPEAPSLVPVTLPTVDAG